MTRQPILEIFGVAAVTALSEGVVAYINHFGAWVEGGPCYGLPREPGLMLIVDGKVEKRVITKIESATNFLDGILYSKTDEKGLYYYDYETSVKIHEEDYFIYNILGGRPVLDQTRKYKWLQPANRTPNEPYTIIGPDSRTAKYDYRPAVMYDNFYLAYENEQFFHVSFDDRVVKWTFNIVDSGRNQRYWQKHLMGISAENFIYFPSPRAVECVSTKNGQRLWRYETDQEISYFSCSDRIICLGRLRDFVAIDPTTGRAINMPQPSVESIFGGVLIMGGKFIDVGDFYLFHFVKFPAAVLVCAPRTCEQLAQISFKEGEGSIAPDGRGIQYLNGYLYINFINGRLLVYDIRDLLGN